MPLKLAQLGDGSIQVKTLCDGQYAVITEWATNPRNIGTIVQRCGHALISSGKPAGNAWLGLFADSYFETQHYRVRVLSDRTTLTIYDNE